MPMPSFPAEYKYASRARLAFDCAETAANKIHRWAGKIAEHDVKAAGGDPTDPVTAIDKEIEQIIVEQIKSLFPLDQVVAEEGFGDAWNRDSADTKDRITWILDPIDGTKNFMHGSPHCCVSLAFAVGLQVECGVIAAPLMGETFWALRGHGSFSTGRQGPLHVSGIHELRRAAVTYDINARDPETLAVWMERCRRLLVHPVQTLRNHGSAALELCGVARGATEAHLEQGLDLWDVAAGWLIVLEAGGALMRFDGQPLRSLTDFAGDILACNSAATGEKLLEAGFSKVLTGRPATGEGHARL